MLIAITVSTNFSDILEITMKQNLKFFDHWYIITEKNDAKTINLIKNIDKIKILYYDFQTNNIKNNISIFNKGGALSYAQNLIYNKYIKCKILILDSDIYLPYNFRKIIEKENFQTNTLYQNLIRIDYFKLTDFYNKTNPKYFKHSQLSCGYFQLYYIDQTIPNNIIYYYGQSYDCSNCDEQFKILFNNNKTLEIFIYHLGKASIHWQGRKDTSDFIIDTKIL